MLHDRFEAGCAGAANLMMMASGHPRLRETQLKRIALFTIAAMGALAAAGAAQAQDMETQMTEGAELYADNCVVCHGANGEGGIGFRLDGNPVLQSAGGVAGMIITGYLEHGMPPFGDELTNEEIAAITTFVRNSWSNAYGGPTDPAMVESLRATVGGE